MPTRRATERPSSPAVTAAAATPSSRSGRRRRRSGRARVSVLARQGGGARLVRGLGHVGDGTGLERADRRTVQDAAVRIEPTAVAWAVPALLGGVPVHQAAEVRA